MADPDPASSSSDPRPDYAEVIVICHGETVWNPERLQGQIDVELNQVGIAQATEVSAVYSSDLIRAYETAQIIAAKCGLPKIVKVPDLRERHLGVLQGLLPCDALRIHPKAYKAKDSGKAIQGGGESVDRLSKRFTSALKRIGMNHLGKQVAVVTHGDVIKSVFKGVDSDILNSLVNVFHLYEHKWVIKLDEMLATSPKEDFR